jgi:hypothetical protein
MGTRIVTGVSGDVTKYFGIERQGREVVHYRGHRQDCRPAMARAREMSERSGGRFSKSREIGYVGSIPQSMIDDWLIERGKTWHDYATDRDLKRAFELFMYAERPAFFMKFYQT